MTSTQCKTAAPGNGSDAKLLHLNAEYRTFHREIKDGQHRDAKGDLPDETVIHLCDFERKIAKTPAASYVGIGIKLRIVIDNLIPVDPNKTRDSIELNIESALADAERLAGATSSMVAPETTSEDPFEALARDWADCKTVCEPIWDLTCESEAPYQVVIDRLRAIERRIANTPTTTLLGIVTKLRLEAETEPDTYDFSTTAPIIKTALAGAEHLLAQSQKEA